jgi:hypothetical protein
LSPIIQPRLSHRPHRPPRIAQVILGTGAERHLPEICPTNYFRLAQSGDGMNIPLSLEISCKTGLDETRAASNPPEEDGRDSCRALETGRQWMPDFYVLSLRENLLGHQRRPNCPRQVRLCRVNKLNTESPPRTGNSQPSLAQQILLSKIHITSPQSTALLHSVQCPPLGRATPPAPFCGPPLTSRPGMHVWYRNFQYRTSLNLPLPSQLHTGQIAT